MAKINHLEEHKCSYVLLNHSALTHDENCLMQLSPNMKTRTPFTEIFNICKVP
jgi:aspartyl/asparaginyl beta-hydroxylase (cupin superfamily)